MLKIKYKDRIATLDEKNRASGSVEAVQYLERLAKRWDQQGDRHMAYAALIQKERNPDVQVLEVKPLPVK